jgi:2-polyprenyl-3-methyl-5-hydroxy-6-metoxy-1,4-benzoquinol methylase
MSVDVRRHWDKVYTRKAPDAVSWYQPHLARSLELIGRAAPDVSAAIIDVGGGESTLVDDLLAKGYRDLTVLDISPNAIEASKKRLGALAEKVAWLTADITEVVLPGQRYDVWHDRAVFHFLTSVSQRASYVRQVKHSMKPRGHVIVATFGPEGPTQCSGLDVVRYDADSLHGEFGPQFRLVEHATEIHRTPSGRMQQFLYCFCKVE